MRSQTGSQSKMRNLDEIQESDPSGDRPSRVGTLLVASIGGACVLFAAVMLIKRPQTSTHVDDDPLGSLVEKSRSEGESPSDEVAVGFPKRLSSEKEPTAALETLRGDRADPDFVLPDGAPTAPPPAGDRLPVMSIPAQHILADAGKELGPDPTDALTNQARELSKETGEEVASGEPGAFQLQVSSFKTSQEAESFSKALRRRGHHAYVEAANVKGRGVWHRVRIGPFKYKRSAEIYRQEFEAKERLVTFIVSPQKTKVRVAQADSDE